MKGQPGTYLQYAQACLEYTFESIRNEERRIGVVLALSLGALGANKFMLQSAEQCGALLHVVVVVGSIPLLIGLVVGVWGMKSETVKPDSQMLPEWIALQDETTYVSQCLDQEERHAVERVLAENRALAVVKVHRSRAYRAMARLFMVGAVPTVLVFAALLLRG